MKKLFVFILLLIGGVTANAQFVKGTFVTGTGYPSSNNTRFAYMEHIPPANSFGHKHPVIVYIAGIDHRGPASTGPTDYSTIDIIKTKGVALMVASSPMGKFHKPGGGSTDWYNWAVFTAQVPSTSGTVPASMVDELIKQRVIAAHGTEVDTNRIIYVGYSLGSGGGMYYSHEVYGLPKISAFFLLASGYNASPNYPLTAASGAPIFVYHSNVDPTAPVSISNAYVNGINAQNPLVPVNYYRFNDLTGSPTNDHDRIRFLMEDTTRSLSFSMTNGDTWAYSELIYETGLRYSRKRMTN